MKEKSSYIREDISRKEHFSDGCLKFA